MPRSFEIPFQHLRALLPADGVRTVVWRGKMNKWPQNSEPFLRHETGEIAFGRAIRANPDDRGQEESLSPGIEALDGRIHLRGGWAVHKAVDSHSDFFDGKFTADCFVRVENGDIQTRVDNFNFTWNASWPVRVIDLIGLFRGIVLAVLRRRIESRLDQELERAVDREVDRLIAENPEIAPFRDRISVEIVPNAVRVTVNIED